MFIFILLTTLNCKYNTYEEKYFNIFLKTEYIKAIQLLSDKKYDKALLKFEDLYLKYPYNIYTEKVLVFLIYINYLEHNFLVVLELIDEFLLLYDSSNFTSYIFYIKILAELSLDTNNTIQNLFKTNRNYCNPFYTKLAINDTKFFFKKYPNSIYNIFLKKKLIYMIKRMKIFELNIIRYYYQQKKYLSTINRCLIFLKDYPYDNNLIKKILNNSLNKLK
ncbi:outer membrane protein assembly factor BamD [Enterobacteriaceae endosymbiont of Donacia provostii]|uniref:outer membrane protein assembly factor BamD n=1 Tax=Enterobacteriaceae endosymbiont of Donacia provostii TaxID=2675781 RepID=UPI0014568A26|nr:outer membrane protein assembly factor BamD [Enterobacteriaceae endosymbiont of Donacia provostii]